MVRPTMLPNSFVLARAPRSATTSDSEKMYGHKQGLFLKVSSCKLPTEPRSNVVAICLRGQEIKRNHKLVAVVSDSILLARTAMAAIEGDR